MFTFTAQVGVGEVEDDVTSSTSIIRTTALGMTRGKSSFVRKLGVGGASGEADKANELFCKLGKLFYDRFKMEGVIDERRKADFIKNGIPNAPPLTEGEQDMIAKLMREVEAMKAKRISGTVNDSVEKFLHRDKKGGAAWGMTVAKMDVAAITLFTEVSEATSDNWLQYLTQSSRSLRLLYFATLVADLAAGHLRQMG